jgi:hypothetical protein
MASSSRPGSEAGRAELLGRGRRIEFGGRHGPVREDRHHVFGDLDEAAVDVEAERYVAAADAQLAVAQPADERAVVRRDALPSERWATKSACVEHRCFRVTTTHCKSDGGSVSDGIRSPCAELLNDEFPNDE